MSKTITNVDLMLALFNNLFGIFQIKMELLYNSKNYVLVIELNLTKSII